ncbi:hypothetical protein AAC387_Pa03g0271 [Persea americana]
MFVEPARWTIRKRWSPNQWNAGHAKKAVVQTNILYDTWAFISFMTEQLRSYVFMHLHENALMTAWMKRSLCVSQLDSGGDNTNEGNIVVQKSKGCLLLPTMAVNFDRCLVGEVLSVGAEVGGVKAGTKQTTKYSSAFCPLCYCSRYI